MSRSSRIYRLVVVAHCVYPTRYQEDFIMLDGHNLTHVIQCCEEKYQTMLNKSCLFNDTIAPDRTDASRTNSSITIARGVRLRSSIFCQLRDMKQLLLFFNTTKIHQFLILSNLSQVPHPVHNNIINSSPKTRCYRQQFCYNFDSYAPCF